MGGDPNSDVKLPPQPEAVQIEVPAPAETPAAPVAPAAPLPLPAPVTAQSAEPEGPLSLEEIEHEHYAEVGAQAAEAAENEAGADSESWQWTKQRLLDYAQRISKWEGILKEHPISESYIKKHKGHDFSAKGLALEEIYTDKTRNKIDNVVKSLHVAPVYIGIMGIDSSLILGNMEYDTSKVSDAFQPHRVMMDAYGADPAEIPPGVKEIPEVKNTYMGHIVIHNPEKWKVYHEVLEEGNTTLETLKKMYIEAFTDAYITPTLAQGDIQLLDTIRQGKTAEISRTL
jgi:hypothetical protein